MIAVCFGLRKLPSYASVQQYVYFTTLYFKTTCNVRPHFVGPMSGRKMEGLL